MTLRLALCCIGLTSIIASDALAFAPVDGGAFGEVGHRVRTFDDATQSQLRTSAAWKRFVATDGAGWSVRFDQKTRTPHRMWGAPIDLGPTDTETQVVEGLLAFVDDHAELIGVSSEDLSLRTAAYDASTDTWYVDLDVWAGPMRIDGAVVTARIRFGALVLLGADTYPTTPVAGTARLSRELAVDRAVRHGVAPAAMHLATDSALVAVPVEVDGELTLRPTWRVSSRTHFPRGEWTSFVDAETGLVVGARDEVRYGVSQILGEHEVRNPSTPTTISPLPFIQGNDGSDVAYADADGWFDLAGDSVTVKMISPYFRVTNEAGPDASLTFSGDELLITPTMADPAEIDTYVFFHQIREWGERVAPGVMPASMVGHVNLDQTCNAYFDGELNFFRAGDGCNNTGRIADVVYHEWGHGLHYWSLKSGNFDGHLGEGAADVVSFLQTGDPVMAPYFMTNGNGIRNVEPNRVYPDDYVNSEDYVHSNGLIFGGAIWDMWHSLMDAYGEEQGTEITTKIFVGLLKGGPNIEESYDEAVFADDDDGDLSNGTPHQCQILEAFLAHGLGPGGTPSVYWADHEPPLKADAEQPFDLDIALYNGAPSCVTSTPSAAQVSFRVNEGDWQSAPLTVGASAVSGSIPAQPMGTLVEYYVTVSDDQGGQIKAPADGIIRPYSYYVGDVVPIHCDDFEADNGDYVHELLAGEDRDGADDWQWGRPGGVGGDPDEAASGRRVWGNDLGEGEYNGEYQNEKHNRLSSPVLVYEPHLEGVFGHYRRWLTVEDGAFDQARILADGEVVWSNWATTEQKGDEHHLDTEWRHQSIELDGLGDDGSVQLSWDIKSDQGLTMGGWNIDDVCLFAPATADNRLGISDFVAQGDGDAAIELSWTHPRFGPVDEVVVVRSTQGWPTSPEDGEVVFQDNSPTPGETITVIDDDIKHRKTYFYAVYASDGEAWSSFTVDGWNAAGAVAQGEPDLEAAGGCGCSATPGAAMGSVWSLGLLGLLGLRRRRV